MGMRGFIKGALIGAAGVYLLDPISGKGRRAKMRDQALAIARRSRDRAGKLSRHGGNVVEGKVHGMTGVVGTSDRSLDDATVADRVRSEVLGKPDLGASGLVVDVQEGVAHLRGELDDSSTIDRVVALTRAVPGVRDVENLIHEPGSSAPNKVSARSARPNANSTKKRSA
ncbi:MAG: BON domain-containing protein [Actinomycetota bacterium]